jgi:hypothetical protein
LIERLIAASDGCAALDADLPETIAELLQNLCETSSSSSLQSFSWMSLSWKALLRFLSRNRAEQRPGRPLSRVASRAWELVSSEIRRCAVELASLNADPAVLMEPLTCCCKVARFFVTMAHALLKTAIPLGVDAACQALGAFAAVQDVCCVWTWSTHRPGATQTALAGLIAEHVLPTAAQFFAALAAAVAPAFVEKMHTALSVPDAAPFSSKASAPSCKGGAACSSALQAAGAANGSASQTDWQRASRAASKLALFAMATEICASQTGALQALGECAQAHAFEWIALAAPAVFCASSEAQRMLPPTWERVLRSLCAVSVSATKVVLEQRPASGHAPHLHAAERRLWRAAAHPHPLVNYAGSLAWASALIAGGASYQQAWLERSVELMDRALVLATASDAVPPLVASILRVVEHLRVWSTGAGTVGMRGVGGLAALAERPAAALCAPLELLLQPMAAAGGTLDDDFVRRAAVLLSSLRDPNVERATLLLACARLALATWIARTIRRSDLNRVRGSTEVGRLCATLASLFPLAHIRRSAVSMEALILCSATVLPLCSEQQLPILLGRMARENPTPKHAWTATWGRVLSECAVLQVSDAALNKPALVGSLSDVASRVFPQEHRAAATCSESSSEEAWQLALAAFAHFSSISRIAPQRLEAVVPPDAVASVADFMAELAGGAAAGGTTTTATSAVPIAAASFDALERVRRKRPRSKSPDGAHDSLESEFLRQVKKAKEAIGALCDLAPRAVAATDETPGRRPHSGSGDGGVAHDRAASAAAVSDAEISALRDLWNALESRLRRPQ